MAKRPTGGRDQKVCVAQIGAAHGLRGEVRLFSFTQNPEDVGRYGALSGPDGRPFEIVSLRPAGDHFVARFRNIDDRNAAEMLRNIELYVGREKLPPTDDEETYYHSDLIGLTATYRDGQKAGEIVAVHNFGAGDLLEIRLEGAGRTALLPFTEQTVPEVKIAAQQIVIDPPEGAFDTGPAPKDAPKDEI
jgi:16S rRNA processing protein RimM